MIVRIKFNYIHFHMQFQNFFFLCRELLRCPLQATFKCAVQYCLLQSPSSTLYPMNTGVGSLSFLQQIFPTRSRTTISCIAGRFFTNWTIREAHYIPRIYNWTFTPLTHLYPLLLPRPLVTNHLPSASMPVSILVLTLSQLKYHKVFPHCPTLRIPQGWIVLLKRQGVMGSY